MPARHILIATLALLAPPVCAQPHEDYGTMAPDMARMAAMGGMASSGAPDASFPLIVIPHHHSAIDMAWMELKHADDPATQEVARKSINAQEHEIAKMKVMPSRLGVEAPD